MAVSRAKPHKRAAESAAKTPSGGASAGNRVVAETDIGSDLEVQLLDPALLEAALPPASQKDSYRQKLQAAFLLLPDIPALKEIIRQNQRFLEIQQKSKARTVAASQVDKADGDIRNALKLCATPFFVQASYAKSILAAGQVARATIEWERALRWSKLVTDDLLKKEIRRLGTKPQELPPADPLTILAGDYQTFLTATLALKESIKRDYVLLAFTPEFFLTAFESILLHLGRDKAGWVNEEILDRAIPDPWFTREEAVVIGVLKIHYAEIIGTFGMKAKSDSKLTRKQVVRFCRAWAAARAATTVAAQDRINSSAPSATSLVWRIEDTITTGKEVLLRRQQSLFGMHKRYPALDAVAFSRNGNCHLTATMAAICAANRKKIKEIVRLTPQGNITVTFPLLKNEPINLTSLTDAELVMHGINSGDHGIWVAAIDKAYRQFLKQHMPERQLIRKDKLTAAENNHSMIGKRSQTALSCVRLLCGSCSTISLSRGSLVALAHALKSALDKGVPIIALGKQDDELCPAAKHRHRSLVSGSMWERFVNQCNSKGHAVALTGLGFDRSRPERSRVHVHDAFAGHSSLRLYEFVAAYSAIELGQR